MNGIIGKWTKAFILTAVFIFLAGCTYSNQFVVNAVAQEPPIRSAWLAYWDVAAGEKDVVTMGDQLDRLSYFGAYFDKRDHMFIPPELSENRYAQGKSNRKYETYLSFINDKQNSDGTVSLKDIEVLRRLFASDAAMDKHIDEIIAMTLQGGYDGLEIDYERIWKDEKIGQSFVHFTNKLYEKAAEHHLKLRIVLEPSTPFSTAHFVDGPEYVVMFYNLYGLHSGPGPKADRNFIEKAINNMKALPGEKSVALATGGCMWGSNGQKNFLTEMEAKTLAETNGAELHRDEESQCVFFTYKEKDVSYQVWYADVHTLNYWISIAKQQRMNNISLWRLGGNVEIDKIL